MEKIQELTDKLYREGVEKGNAEGMRLVEKAKAEADKLVADARKEADEIVDKGAGIGSGAGCQYEIRIETVCGAGFECIEIGDCECRFRQTGKGYGEGAYGQ